LDLNATVHLDLSEIDAAIEKANQLLALLTKVKESGSKERYDEHAAKKGWD